MEGAVGIAGSVVGSIDGGRTVATAANAASADKPSLSAVGAGVSVAVDVTVGVGVGVSVMVALGVTDRVAVGDAEAVTVTVGVALGVTGVMVAVGGSVGNAASVGRSSTACGDGAPEQADSPSRRRRKA